MQLLPWQRTSTGAADKTGGLKSIILYIQYKSLSLTGTQNLNSIFFKDFEDYLNQGS